MTTLEKAPARPAGPTPLRQPASIRRTSSIDTSWPEGLGRPMLMRGRARDLFTPPEDRPPQVVAEDGFEILATSGREILSIKTSRADAAAQVLVGARGGGRMRALLGDVLANERSETSPLHLLLDDYSGASLVAGWAWSRWNRQAWTGGAMRGSASTAGRNGQMEGICAGFRPGSSALMSDGTGDRASQNSAVVAPLPNLDDPNGWHELAEQHGVGMRRARWLDLTMDEVLRIEIGFQDSATTPDGSRSAVHEYLVSATADPRTFELLSIVADARVLPYRECPAAAPNVSRMLGARLGDFRAAVIERLPGTLGCTHLNDVMRSMADVPALTRKLATTLDEAAVP